MILSKKQIIQLIKIVETTQQILAEANKQPTASARAMASSGTRTRRTGGELVAFKKTIKTERKAGASVAKLAAKHGVTPSYIYQL